MADFLSTLFGGGAEKDAANKNRALYDQYLSNGQSALANGYSTAQGNLNNASNLYGDLASKYGGATSLGLDSLGVNGQAAAQQAQSQFTNNPGYGAAVDAGLDAINRRRATSGMLNSGNADLDALTFGQNLQNQQYNQWQQNLLGFTSPELQATSGQAGAQTNLAGLATQNAQDQIGLQGNYTSGNAAANNAQAAGEASGAKNLLSGGLSLATLGLTAGGVGGFGSSGLSSLGAPSPNVGYSLGKLFGR